MLGLAAPRHVASSRPGSLLQTDAAAPPPSSGRLQAPSVPRRGGPLAVSLCRRGQQVPAGGASSRSHGVPAPWRGLWARPSTREEALGSSARFLTPELTGLPDQPAALPTSKVTGHPAESCPFLTVWRPAVLRGGGETATRACCRAPVSRHPTSSAPAPRRARFPAPALPAQR